MVIRKTFLLCLMTCLLFAAGACMPDVPAQDQPPTGTNAIFDTTTGLIPLPHDILRNPLTGLLMLPPAPTDSPLTLEVKASLNTINGWLTSQTINIPFDAVLDSTTLTTANVGLFDVTDPANIVKFKASEYFIFFNKSRTPATAAPYMLSIKTKAPAAMAMPADWKMGHKYIVAVNDQVKGKDSALVKVIEAQVPYFLKDKESLLSTDGKTSTTILPLANAQQLEPTRAAYAKAWDALEAGIPGGSPYAERLKTNAYTMFTVQSGALPIFNPSQVNTLVPWPIDLKSAAMAPLSAKPYICFNAPIKPETAAAGIKFYKFTGIPATPLAPVEFTTNFTGVPDTTSCLGALKLEIVPKTALSATSKYIIIMSDSIIGANGVKTAAFSYFSLIRDTNALVTDDKLNSPLIDNTLDVLILLGGDPNTATQAEWDAAYAMLLTNVKSLDTLRAAYNGQLPGGTDLFAIAKAVGVERLNVTAMWVFTTGTTP